MTEIPRRILIDGVETSYLEAGSPGQTNVLLLHDGAWGGSSSVSWGSVIPLMKEHAHVLALDLLGFGGSAKIVRLDSSPYGFRINHILSFLDALDVREPLHVVGTSFGGSIALNMLAVAPERIASVVSISGTGGPWRTEFGLSLLGSWDGTLEGLRPIVGALADETEYFQHKDHLLSRHASASTPGHYRAMMSPGIPLPEALRQVNNAASNWPSQIAGSETPVLLVAGIRDALIESGWEQKLTSVLRRGDSLTLDSLHSPNLSHPKEVASIILDWTRSAPPLGSSR